MLYQYNEKKEKFWTRANIPDTQTVQQGRTQFHRRHPASACTHPITHEGIHKRQMQPCPHSTCTVEPHLSGSAWPFRYICCEFYQTNSP